VKSTHSRHLPETEKANVVAKRQQSVTTTWHFCRQNTLDVFNANQTQTAAANSDQFSYTTRCQTSSFCSPTTCNTLICMKCLKHKQLYCLINFT